LPMYRGGRAFTFASSRIASSSCTAQVISFIYILSHVDCEAKWRSKSNATA
jgi:hypothetical protein